MISETFVESLLDHPSDLAAAYGHAVGRNAPGSGDATQVLAALARDIARYWNDLDRETQTFVQRYFKVVVEGKEIRVSM